MMIGPSGEEHRADTCRSWFVHPGAATIVCWLMRLERSSFRLCMRVLMVTQFWLPRGDPIALAIALTSMMVGIDRYADRGSHPDDPLGSGSTAGSRWKTRITGGSKT